MILTRADIIVFVFMGLSAGTAAYAFVFVARYLFDRGLADPNASMPNLMDYYRSYIDHTRREIGQIGKWFWIHAGAAGLFILIGVVYTIVRFLLNTMG